MEDEFRKPVCPCGKIGFDKRGAETKRNFLMKRGNGYLRIYQCDQSDWWHLTKTVLQDDERKYKYINRRK